MNFSWNGPAGAHHRAQGTVHNISAGGIFISTNEPPPLTSQVRFSVFFRSFLAASRLVMQTTARVIRLEPSPGGNAPAAFAAAFKTYTLRNEKDIVEKEDLNRTRRTQSDA
jgi:hypothetical protein